MIFQEYRASLYFPFYFKQEVLLLFLHNRHGTPEFTVCGILAGEDLGYLRRANAEPSVDLRRANTEPSLDFRKANMEPSMHFRRANRET